MSNGTSAAAATSAVASGNVGVVSVGNAARRFEDVVSWIRDNGGFVHDALALSEDRSVYVRTAVSAGTVLLRVPDSCLLTAASATQSLGTLKRIAKKKTKDDEPTTTTTTTTTTTKRKSDDDDDDDDGALSDDDVVLAAYLALHADDVSNACSFFRPYLRTLPSSSSHDRLPRRWDDAKRRRWLRGTTTARRAEDDARRVHEARERVAEALGDGNLSARAFDDGAAAASSRAFAALGPDGADALVPVLDLLDHARRRANVRYGREERNGCVRASVADDVDLAAGDALRDTYGARGNAQLLTRYGFCVSENSNLEPDGSCNDVLSFALDGDRVVAELRTGPKSYTYGGFVRAIEYYREQEERVEERRRKRRQKSDDDKEDEDNEDEDNEDEEEDEDDEDEDDDMEAFLNGEDVDDDDDDLHGLYDDDDGDGALPSSSMDDVDAAESARRDADALRTFSSALSMADAVYHRFARDDASSTVDPDLAHAAILVASERRTIRFFKRAATLTAAALQGRAPSVFGGLGTDEDGQLLERQAVELKDAFLKIRYPSLVGR